MRREKRAFTTEFRVQVAQRVLGGESVSKLQDELAINRSVLYRWRDQYRKHGAAGLDWPDGRPPGIPVPAETPKPDIGEEVALRRHIANLDRKIRQQRMQLDYFKRAFKRVKDPDQPKGDTSAQRLAVDPGNSAAGTGS